MRAGKTILVPLTNSLYVPGKLADVENVIVDVGTGYYVKKVRPYASPLNAPSVSFACILQPSLVLRQRSITLRK